MFSTVMSLHLWLESFRINVKQFLMEMFTAILFKRFTLVVRVDLCRWRFFCAFWYKI